ncbi:MAG: class I SAM-dependent methyltransferase [Acidimicrobiia bacterium]|nr:class I SAM-dependent methyltransferase [Acidimicrobiia bacterium]
MGAETRAVAAARYCGIELGSTQLELLVRYHDWLASEGHRAGGIGPDERNRLWDRHIADSLVFACGLADGRECLDIGSGAGLPGIPLAIAMPAVEFRLLDRSGRRCDLMRRAVTILGLENCRIEQNDIREIDDPVESIVSRAAIPIATLMIHVKRLLVPGGVAVIALSRTGEGDIPTKIPDGLLIRVESVPPGILDTGANLLRIEAT